MFSFSFSQTGEGDESLDDPIEDTVGRTCYSMDKYFHYLSEHPELQQELEDRELRISKYVDDNYENIANGNEATEDFSDAVAFIPVVVHVLSNAAENDISQAQIQSQIDILNEDYNKQNGDVNNVPFYFSNLVGKARIRFCLATIDPDGNSTTGITRTNTSVAAFDADTDDMKFSSSGGHDIWDRTKYLNIWVVPSFVQSGLLGYAQFPHLGTVETDGVVIVHTAFGNIGTATSPFDKGRTATHEIGHWLNLHHIWGDLYSSCSDDDLVYDTPKQRRATYKCPSGKRKSCSNGPYGNMYMNFMDYVNDACMFAFTHGQVARMHAEQQLNPRSNFFLSPIQGNQNACLNSNNTYTVNSSSLFTYSWSTNMGAIISGINSNSVTIKATNLGNNKKVYLTAISPCGDEIQIEFNVNVGNNGISNLNGVSFSPNSCHYVAHTNTLSSAISYEWSDDNFSTFVSTSIPQYGTFDMDDFANISVRAKDACGNISNTVSNSSYLGHISGCPYRMAFNPEKSITIFPNPNNTLELKVKLVGIDYSPIRILDISGREIYKGSLKEAGTVINISFLEDGIYFVETYISLNQREITKLVITK